MLSQERDPEGDDRCPILVGTPRPDLSGERTVRLVPCDAPGRTRLSRRPLAWRCGGAPAPAENTVRRDAYTITEALCPPTVRSRR